MDGGVELNASGHPLDTPVIPGVGYIDCDTRFISHGDKRNDLVGGSCREFIELNKNVTQGKCCAKRSDDCYMIHLNTRCYCDQFCDSEPGKNDCCPDKKDICGDSYHLKGMMIYFSGLV